MTEEPILPLMLNGTQKYRLNSHMRLVAVTKNILSCHAHEGLRTTLGSQFPPSTVGPRDQTQTLRLVWEARLPMEHAVGL